MEAPLLNYKPKTRKSKTLLKYSCEEIEERMANGLCIFCEEQDTPGHQDLKHKRAMIFVAEKEEPGIDETLVESDASLIEAATVPNLDPFVKPLEHVTSALPVSIVLNQEDDLAKTVSQEEKLSVPLMQNIEHMVGKQPEVEDRVWEPGGLIPKPPTQSQGIESFCNTIQQNEAIHSKEMIQCLISEVQKADRPHKHARWVKAVDLFHSVDTSCWDQFLKHPKCPKSWNFKYKHGEYMVKSFLQDQNPETVRNKKLQVVQQRPHEIRCCRDENDENDEKIFLRLFGDMDAWFQEVVTTAFGIGVSLKCLDKYLSHDQVLGLTTKTSKPSRDWSMWSALKIRVCTDFYLAQLFEFEIYGWECKKQMIILIDQGQVWEPGGVVTEHDQWKELEKGYACGRLTSLVQEMFVKVMYMIEKNKTAIVTDSHAMVPEQKWLLHLLHIKECRGLSLLTIMHLSQEKEEFYYPRGMEQDSSSCARRQDKGCVILLMNASGELNSVCRLVLGGFLTQQMRRCGFFRFLRQWKWYPPDQFYKALSNRSVMLWTWMKTVFFPWLVVDTENKKLTGPCYGNKNPKEKHLEKVDASADLKTTTAPIKHVKVVVRNSDELIVATTLLVGPVNDHRQISFALTALPQYLLEKRNKEGFDATNGKKVQCHNLLISIILIPWKEEPPDQGLKLSSLRTRMF
ncbi:hypothetical protein HA466_0297120 [Hirschfeldia incana]|nr:hypothetical protein HA466_0297120 [Hirschfeldia incana]